MQRVTLRDDITNDARITELEQTLKRTQAQLAKANAKTSDLVAAVYQGARDAATISGHGKAMAPPRSKHAKHAEVALLHLTDTHIGAVTKTFNTSVAERRVMSTIMKTIRLAEIQREAHPVDECVVILGGDLIEQTGQFPHQAWAVDASTFEQLFTAARILEAAILTLADHFATIRVYLTPGNHGRVGRGKGRQSLDYESETNWDRIVGRIIGERVHEDPRIEWVFPESWYQLVTIGEYACLAHHGDTIRGFGGNIPAYGIIKKHLAWSSGVMPHFVDAYLGHFHSPMTLPMNNGGRVFVTPSLVSDSAYAKEFVAATSLPAQRLHFVDPRAGRVTSEYLIWVD
jgi:hypothetical protein